MILVVLLVGGCLGWLVRSARIQREAVAALRQSGGVPTYDWEWVNGQWTPDATPRAPKWLVDRLGPDYFGSVFDLYFPFWARATNTRLLDVGRLTGLQQLSIENSNCTDAALSNLSGLTSLKTLSIGHCTHITDAGLAQLKPLHRLQELDVGYTSITGEGLGHLDRLTSLRNLRLDGCQITESGFANLAKLVMLETLSLQNCNVSNYGFARIAELVNLKELRFADSRFSDPASGQIIRPERPEQMVARASEATSGGLEHLKKLTNLSSLNLHGTTISDAALTHLNGITSLSKLDLGFTEITDAGIAHLTALSKLSSLVLRATNVSDEGVEELKQALPRVTVR
jgi:Leucine-rich repeat (LRR) protein